MDEATLIWEALSRKKDRVVPRRRIVELARRIDLNPESTIRTLTRNDRIMPTFKGHYYVKSPEEILHHASVPLDVFAHAAKAKGIGSWYYGLYSALRLNGMTHEHRRDEHVIATGLYRPKGVVMADRRFLVLKWKPEMTRFGLERRGPYRFSDPEKTVLDFAYWDHFRKAKGHGATNEWREHLHKVDRGRLESYLPKYPAGVRDAVEAES